MYEHNRPKGMSELQARLLGYGIALLVLLLGALVGWEALGMPGV